jgi:hypothetical protein
MLLNLMIRLNSFRKCLFNHRCRLNKEVIDVIVVDKICDLWRRMIATVAISIHSMLI